MIAYSYMGPARDGTRSRDRLELPPGAFLPALLGMVDCLAYFYAFLCLNR